jgi:hypothetical protein
MREVANTTISVLRGKAANPFGDLVDSRVPHYSSIPASLVETNKQVFDPSSQTPRTVRQGTCVLESWVDVTSDDQIRNESTGRLYAITSLDQPATLMGAPVDLTLTLRRISAAGT